MTITTEPTTIPEVPAWLDLAAVVPDDAVRGVALSLDFTKRNIDTFREVASSVRMWVREVEELVRDLPEDVGTHVLAVTGLTELHQLAFDIAHLFEAAANGTAASEETRERLDDISEVSGEEVQS